MKVLETQLPGVGTRYKLQFPDESSFTILLHNDGKREAYWSGRDTADNERLFSVTELQSRKIAEIFDGTYFNPVPDDIETVFEEARIRWVEIPANSAVVGNTIRDEEIRTRTGASIIAIQRGTKTISNPSPDTTVENGDTLVIVGSNEAHSAMDRLLKT